MAEPGDVGYFEMNPDEPVEKDPQYLGIEEGVQYLGIDAAPQYLGVDPYNAPIADSYLMVEPDGEFTEGVSGHAPILCCSLPTGVIVSW